MNLLSGVLLKLTRRHSMMCRFYAIFAEYKCDRWGSGLIQRRLVQSDDDVSAGWIVGGNVFHIHTLYDGYIVRLRIDDTLFRFWKS